MSESNGKSRILTIRQQKAMSELLRGSTITAAAEFAGVKRETVHAWLRQPSFRSEFHDGCERLRAEFEDRLVAIASKATEVVCQALDDGNEKIAMDVLRLVNRDRSQIDLTVEKDDAELDEMIAETIAELRSGNPPGVINENSPQSDIQHRSEGNHSESN